VPIHIPRKVAGSRQIAKPKTGQLNNKPVAIIKQSRKKVRIKIAKAIVDLRVFGFAILSAR